LPGPYLDSPWVVSPDFKGFPVFLSTNLYLSAGWFPNVLPCSFIEKS
jgi:hypothetical protein